MIKNVLKNVRFVPFLIICSFSILLHLGSELLFNFFSFNYLAEREYAIFLVGGLELLLVCCIGCRAVFPLVMGCFIAHSIIGIYTSLFLDTVATFVPLLIFYVYIQGKYPITDQMDLDEFRTDANNLAFCYAFLTALCDMWSHVIQYQTHVATLNHFIVMISGNLIGILIFLFLFFRFIKQIPKFLQ